MVGYHRRLHPNLRLFHKRSVPETTTESDGGENRPEADFGGSNRVSCRHRMPRR